MRRTGRVPRRCSPSGPTARCTASPEPNTISTPRARGSTCPRLEDWLAKISRSSASAGYRPRRRDTRSGLDAPASLRRSSFARSPVSPVAPCRAARNDGTMPADLAKAITGKISADDPDGARILLDGNRRLAVERSACRMAAAGWHGATTSKTATPTPSPWRKRCAAAVVRGCRRVAGSRGFPPGGSATAAMPRSASRRPGKPAIPNCSPPRITGSRAVSCAAASPRRPRSRCGRRARYDETLYGMLALEQLGQALPDDHDRPDLTGGGLAALSRRRQCPARGNACRARPTRGCRCDAALAGADRAPAGISRPRPPRPRARPDHGTAQPGVQRAARCRGRTGGALAHYRSHAPQRLAGRSRARFRPCPAGIELPRRGREPGQCHRADAGPSHRGARIRPCAGAQRCHARPEGSGDQHGTRPAGAVRPRRQPQYPRPPAQGHGCLQRRHDAGGALEQRDPRPGRSADVDGVDSLLGNARLCEHCDAQLLDVSSPVGRARQRAGWISRRTSGRPSRGRDRCPSTPHVSSSRSVSLC